MPRSSWQCTESVGPLDAAHVLAQIAEQLRKLIRHRVAHRVGNVDRRCAGIDHRFNHLRQKLKLGARGILGRKFHIRTALARHVHRIDGEPQDLILRHVELVLAVDRAGRQEHVQAVTRRIGER